jgi:hypothetical protein
MHTNSRTHSNAPTNPAQATPPPRWRTALADAAQDSLPDLRQPQLAMLLHALGAARSRGGAPGFLDAVLEELAARFDKLGPQALTTCAWALARLRHVPPRPWLAGYFTASFRLLPSYRTQELAVTLWALARLRLYPGDPWLDEFFDTSEALLDTPQLRATAMASNGGGGGYAASAAAGAAGQGFSTLDLAMTGYALAQLNLRPPKSWARRYCASVLRHKGELTKPLLQQVLVALGSFRIGNMDGWRMELYAAAGFKLTRRLRGRRGSKRLRPGRLDGRAMALRQQQQGAAGQGQGQQPEGVDAWQWQPPPPAAQQQQQQQQQQQSGSSSPPQQQQQQQRQQQWSSSMPPPPPPALPHGASAEGLRLILDARRSSMSSMGSGSDTDGGS